MATVNTSRTEDGRKRFHVRVYRDGRQYMGTGKTEAEARRRAEDKARERKERTAPDGKQRLARYFEQWLAAGADTKAAATNRHHREMYDRFIRAQLGDYRLEELTLPLLRRWLEKLPSDDYRRRCRALLRAVLERATEDGALPRNPCQTLKAPPCREGRLLRWDDRQAWTFWALVHDHPYRAYFALALAFPVRPGELLGLRWSHVNLADGTVEIAGSRSTYWGSTIAGRTKTRSSPRTVRLNQETVDVLRDWKMEQNETRLAMGSKWRGEDYVCTGPRGAPLPINRLRCAFRELVEAADLPPITLYELRHTAVSRLKDAGASSKAVSRLAGHGDVRVTERVYWRTRIGEEAEAVASLSLRPKTGENAAM